MSVSTIDFYCLTLVGEEYRQNYGGKLLNPPGLSNIDEIDFWLHGLQIWECVTGIDKKKQDPVIYLSLPYKVRSADRDNVVEDLNKDDDLNILINKLETSYVKDKKSSVYISYKKFETFQRPSDMNITDS